MANQIWLVYECERWEDSSVAGVYTSADKAEARKAELEAACKVIKETHKRYKVWPAVLNAPIRSLVEWQRDRHCVGTEDNNHVLLGSRCTVCDITLDE